ncbi:alpha/beta fold hydrolase [Janibacter sp. GS2]|uniref:alpha/beta fold hydrolase n=1 Tax=Janibacter sp. GS2 TaxID=3442646 RepID=UPI003EBBABDC
MTTPARSPLAHPPEVERIHRQVLSDAGLDAYTLRTSDGAGVHTFERGVGPPALMLHGSGSPGLLWWPLVRRLDGIRAIVVDRPGFGLSDPSAAGFGPSESVEWVGDVLDALELPAAVIVGHSMGGLWGLRFALACPHRVRGLAMLGTPSLPGTRAPLPFRLLGTPGVRAVLARQRETPASFHRFATMIGEGGTVGAHPELVDLMVAVGNDPVAGRAVLDEVGRLLSPWGLFSRTGFRRDVLVGEAELGRVDVPTLLMWGEKDPVGSGHAAHRIQGLIPNAELEVVPGGHAPWLGQAATLATTLVDWVQRLGDW